MIRLSAAFSYLSILKEWKAELALLADLQRMVYPQKVTRQLYVEGQGKIASQRPMFYHCVMSPTDYVTNFFWILRLQSHTNADAKRILLAPPPADWRRQLGRPCITWLSTVQQIWNNTTLRSPKQQIWLRTASVEDDVDVWRYAILELHARNDDNDESHTDWNSQHGSELTTLQVVTVRDDDDEYWQHHILCEHMPVFF